MTGFEIFVVLLICCALKRMSRLKEQARSVNPHVPVSHNALAEVGEIQRSVDEALSVINKTKDIETGIREFAAVKNKLKKLAGESSLTIRITMILGDREICRELEIGSADADASFDRLERDWMRTFFTEKIDTFMNQSGETSDPVLKIKLMRDAVQTALKGLEYLPDDEELKEKVASAELRLKLTADG